jgi:uncharacterized NAD(P)/FAD-binding protein YdhS
VGKKRVVIVGGGFTGAVTAIHLARETSLPMEISVVEPREDVGRGLAYSATDPDHRINAPAATQVLLPDRPRALVDWLERNGECKSDPEMEASGSVLYPRRSAFGAFVNAEFVAHVAGNPSGSNIRHVRCRAVELEPVGARSNVHLDTGQTLEADLAIITTSNEQPAIPQPFLLEDAGHPNFIADPWDMKALGTISSDARILILGAGLTAADVIATVSRDKPQATISAISRSGIRPTSRTFKTSSVPLRLWERLNAEPSLFEESHGALGTMREVLRALRLDIAAGAAVGRPWQVAFDELRDSARRVWTALPDAEKRRFQRHLRRRYESCRFRYPPQTEAKLEAAENQGRLNFLRGSIDQAIAQEQGFGVTWTSNATGQIRTDDFDCIVNCIGPDSRPDHSGNPLLQRMIKDGHARVSPLRVGIDVDLDCRLITANGRPHPTLFALGPLTYATFGYPLGVPYIVDQVIRTIPAMLTADSAERVDRPST